LPAQKTGEIGCIPIFPERLQKNELVKGVIARKIEVLVSFERLRKCLIRP
jgi:hypothetical protein